MTDDKRLGDTSVINDSLQKMAKGTGIVLIGSSLGLFIGFIGQILLIRYWTQNDFGIFSLALTVLTICATISTLGMKQGVIRSIAYVMGKNENKKIPELISVSIFFSIATSLLLGLIVFLLSDIIAINLFHEPALITPLKIFAMAIPFYTLIDIFVSIFRGFGQVKPTVFFQNILLGIFFPLFLLIIIIFKLSFLTVFYAYFASLIIICILIVIYILHIIKKTSFMTVKKTSFMTIFSVRTVTSPVAKELLFFSLPLLGSILVVAMINWTDTLMLGAFKTPVDVGLYTAARSLVKLIAFPLGALLLIYMPVISKLYGKDMLCEMKRTFSILVKWLCFATLPLFLILFLFPEIVLNFIFGQDYALSANVLRILSLGLIIHNFVGPCGATLISMGHPRFVMFASSIAAILNIGLNVLLIPSFGIEGAAIASAGSLILVNIIKSMKLYSISGMQPLSKNLIKSTIPFLLIVLSIYFILQNFLIIRLWMLPCLFIAYYVIYVLFILLTKSFDQEDIIMLQRMGRKTGIKSNRIKKFLIKFVT
jgi:O-antigen/teichoic acid export membrane protein